MSEPTRASNSIDGGYILPAILRVPLSAAVPQNFLPLATKFAFRPVAAAALELISWAGVAADRVARASETMMNNFCMMVEVVRGLEKSQANVCDGIGGRGS